MAAEAVISIPVLETGRLVLRAPRAADFDAYAETLTSDRARYIDGPFSRNEAWRDFSTDAGSWVLRGFGSWAIEVKETGEFAGIVLLHRPDHYPERELGWVLQAGAEGRGYATEAAVAASAHAFGALGWPTLVSYIEPENDRSIALAERIGGVRDDACPRPGGPGEVLVYRYGPEAAQ